jgi:hypothetical protein
MKRIPLLLFSILVAFVACKKNGVSDPVSSTNYWSLGLDTMYGNTPSKKITFNIANVFRKNENGYFILSGTDAAPSLDSLQLYFSTEPTRNKQYKSISFNWVFYDYGLPLDSNQIGIKVTNSNKTNYYDAGVYFGTGMVDNLLNKKADSVAVTVNNGKIKVTIPRLLTFFNNQTGIDSVLLQGVIMEK